ncbi:MAG: PLP-dependent transferase [Spirochaetaceae bacterium]|nr:MAG: PLP-dependent transferase [Spirochaetaceae bacterium]
MTMSPIKSMDHRLLREAIADTYNDLEEVLYLTRDCMGKLRTFIGDLRRVKTHIDPLVYQETLIASQQYTDLYFQQETNIIHTMNDLGELAPSETLLVMGEDTVCQSRNFLRSYQERTGALVTSTDWQSPSYAHAMRSQAGRQTNTIYATINDYKRDQSWDTYYWEHAFLKEYIDAIIKFPIRPLATSSGMSAFTTIVNYLTMEHASTRPVCIGSSIYYENKLLLQSLFGDRIVQVDESDTDHIISVIKTHNPCFIFFDSMTNAPGLPVPDMTAIIRFLVGYVKQDTFLVVDNTCLSAMFQPLPLFYGRLTKLRLIVFESLLKYHQFGMDRVPGGVIWATGGDTGKLFDYRDHLGTILPDALVQSLPTPNRKLLTARLARYERNASLIASRLEEWIDTHVNHPYTKIVYPGLPNHSMHKENKSLPYHGCYFIVEFKKKKQTVATYKRFISFVLQTAKRQRVDIVAGTSFGLNSTRIYLTALRSRPTIPFVRIAVGTEHRIAIEKVLAVLISSLSHFK